MDKTREIVENIIQIEIEDGVNFSITRVSNIMEGHDYPGVRFILEATLDKLRQVIKIDISTGDVITPRAVEYSYKLMFEDRTISIWTYNLETLLGEKLETIMARETANTRMRDFYDIHVLLQRDEINYPLLKKAFIATSNRRSTEVLIPRFADILEAIREDASMKTMWDKYCRDNFFVGNISWEEVNASVLELKDHILKNI